MSDWVRIHGLELDCIVGLRPHERTRAQRIRLDLGLQLSTREAAIGGRIEATADYDRVANEVCALLLFRRYRLVEMAAEELCAMVLGTYHHVEAVELQLEKPGALEGRARAAAVGIRRCRADYGLPARGQPQSAGTIISTRDALLSVHALAPGQSVPDPDAAELRACSWVISGALRDERGTPREPGLAENCEPGTGRVFRNLTEQPVWLFRCAVHL